jgi:hypothetical protein
VPRDEKRGEALARLLGRPILLICRCLVGWGTLYGLTLIDAATTEGPRAALQKATSGRDPLAGFVNLALTGVAAVVWVGAGVAALLGRLRGKGRRAGGPPAM